MRLQQMIVYAGVALFFFTLQATNQQNNASSYETVLHTFAQLAHRCHETMRATTNQTLRTICKTITHTYRSNENIFRFPENYTLKECEAVMKTCTETLEIFIEPQSITRMAIATRPQTTSDELVSHINLFLNEHGNNLLQPTTTRRLLERISFKTIIEIIYILKIHNPEKNPESTIPHWKKRFHLEGLSSNTKQAMGDAGLRVIAHLLTDEFLPAGISSQKQKLLESITPIVASGLFASAILSQRGTPLAAKPAKQILSKVLIRTLLARFYLNRQHRWYPLVNAIATIFPTTQSKTFKTATWGNLADTNTLINILIDLVSTSIIYDGLPALIEHLLPNNRMQLNPQHRRKAVKTIIRDILDRYAQAVTTAAFSQEGS